MKRRSLSVLIGLFLFVMALGLAEIFPGLQPYLPNFDHLIRDIAGETTYSRQPSGTASAQTTTYNPTDDVVLALSWQTAFCETAPNKRECKTQKKGRYDTTNFTLHGLWPEKQYCSRTPYRNVSDKLWKAMKIAMPGTASGLHKHEWEKHGTCYSDTADRYYADALRLVVAFNQTSVRSLFKDNIGRQISASTVRGKFNEVFGAGTGDRVLIHCVRDGERTLIQELRIRLKGNISSANLPVLLKQARAQKQGCKGGIVDAVGIQ